MAENVLYMSPSAPELGSSLQHMLLEIHRRSSISYSGPPDAVFFPMSTLTCIGDIKKEWILCHTFAPSTSHLKWRDRIS